MSNASQERQGRALELHLAGVTYDQIASMLGFGDRSAARKAVVREMARRRVGDTPAAAGELELARLDAMLRGLWPAARRGDVRAVDAVLRVQERRTTVLHQLQATPPPAPVGNGVVADFQARLRARETGSSR